MRVGLGYDTHRLVSGRKLILGGVDVPFEKGLLGHSDADVLCHAIIDSILGALGAGDIGRHFPDTDSKWKGASSLDLLSHTTGLMVRDGYEVAWLDSIIVAEQPKLQPHIDSMKNNISGAGIPLSSINIKAKTNEGMGAVGQQEGIMAQAVCLLQKL